MSMSVIPPRYITEHWLAENARLLPGGELRLPAACRLTPAARDLLSAQGIRVRFTDAAGRVFVEAAAGAHGEGGEGGEASKDSNGTGATNGNADVESVPRRQVHPLTGESGHVAAHCPLCQQDVARKGEALTHLNAHEYVAKNDPRIAFRGRVDSAIAQAVRLQAEWQVEGVAQPLQDMLADLRAALGGVLRAETLGEPAPKVGMGAFSEDQLHAVSHQPLKHLGHDHLVPALEHGLQVARLNVLRTAIREAELAGAAAFIERDYRVVRGDLLQALNRLSSAVYVLMLLVLVAQRKASGGSA